MTPSIGANLRRLAMTIALAFLVTSAGVGYWTLVAGESLSSDPFNPRLVAAIRDRRHGGADQSHDRYESLGRSADGEERRRLAGHRQRPRPHREPQRRQLAAALSEVELLCRLSF